VTRLPEIWNCIKTELPKGRWVSLDDIYRIVESNPQLDEEDFE
jgi:hypothetical protein